MARLWPSADPRSQRRERLLEREQSEHFLSLPVEFQEELRGRWQAERERFDERFDDRKRYLGRSAFEGAVILFLGQLLFSWSWAGMLLALPVGAGTGAVWYLTRARRFMCMVQIIPGFLLVVVVGGPSIMTLFEAAFVVSTAAVAGVLREFRLGDDSVM